MKREKATVSPLPVHANEFVVWLHSDAIAIEFKTKVGAEIEERVALVLMHPEKVMELAEVIGQVLESYEEARRVPEDKGYRGVEFG